VTPSCRRPSTSSAILRVSEAGIPWANGELGPAIQEALLAQDCGAEAILSKSGLLMRLAGAAR
jgi:hypothetical protein